MAEWFEIDKEGFKSLQSGKPLSYVVRELVQNALDAAKSKVQITVEQAGPGMEDMIVIKVGDDGKGFKNIEDAWKLFRYTEKRKDYEARGRFCMGEKQALVRCENAQIVTTCGAVFFDANGRHLDLERKTLMGTLVSVWVPAKSDQRVEISNFIDSLIPPSRIGITYNGDDITRPARDYSIEVSLPTVADTKGDGVLRNTRRNTRIHLYRSKGASQLYEMGIPICSVEGFWDIDVQQKVPLDLDRDNVSPAYLRELFAAIINVAYRDVTPEVASAPWVRAGCSSPNIEKKALSRVLEARWGDKVAVATPGDPSSMDDALSKGFKVVHGSEMSAEEWEQIRRHDTLASTHSMFPHATAEDYEMVKPDAEMKKVGDLAVFLAKKLLGVDIHPEFAKWGGSVAANYGNGNLVFNVKNLGKGFFKAPMAKKVLDLILHEIAHEGGNHTEAGYHEALSGMGAEICILALEHPEVFKPWRE